jgi:hypothetical protein
MENKRNKETVQQLFLIMTLLSDRKNSVKPSEAILSAAENGVKNREASD